MSDRKHYEEAVVLGIVFSPTLLLAIPFVESSSHVLITIVGVSMLLVLTLSGAIWFRRRLGATRSIRRWHFVVASLLCCAFSLSAVSLAGRIAGVLAALLMVSVLLIMLVGAWRMSSVRNASTERASVDDQAIARFAAIGATIGSALLAYFGGASVAVVIGILHLILAVISGLVVVVARSGASQVG